MVGEIARTILRGFNKHFDIFRETTREAHDNFIVGEWMDSRRAAIRRISLYDTRTRETIAELRERSDTDIFEPGAVAGDQVLLHGTALSPPSTGTRRDLL